MKLPFLVSVPLKVGGILVGIIGVLQTLIENLEIIPYLLDCQKSSEDTEKAGEDEMYFAEAIKKREC